MGSATLREKATTFVTNKSGAINHYYLRVMELLALGPSLATERLPATLLHCCTVTQAHPSAASDYDRQSFYSRNTEFGF